jgi:hypothetical protein
MSRISSKRKSSSNETEDDDPQGTFVVKNEAEDNDDEQKPNASGRSKAARTSRPSNAREEDEDDEEQLEDDKGKLVLTLTQHQSSPEKSQAFPQARDNERAHLSNMDEDERIKVVTDLSRLVLFKALAGEHIDRLKCLKAANTPKQVSSAVWEQVQLNLSNVFGFELKKAPAFLKKLMGSRYSDRYYCVNAVQDDDQGTHCKAIHSLHASAAVEKGVLMVALAFIFCKGNPLPGSNSTIRWIVDQDLYKLLHALDDSLPQDAPSVVQRKVNSTQTPTCSTTDKPNIDLMLDALVHKDYLLKEKNPNPEADGGFVYAMGPRAALEVGRRQIVYFCAEILDEQPDPTMLAELEQVPTQTQTQ